MADANQGRLLGEWYVKMYEAYRAMPEEEKESLREWERQHLQPGRPPRNPEPGHHVGVSDWPGWANLIGPKPTL